MRIQHNNESPKILQGALLGCGHVTKYHMRAWEQIENVKIVAVYNRTISKAEAIAKDFGISTDHVYADYRELLEKESLDFVDITTAPHVHQAQVEAAARLQPAHPLSETICPNSKRCSIDDFRF